MKVYTQGDAEVALTQDLFAAAGGEGAVYAIGSTGYKIFHDSNKVIPVAKIQELGAIADPDVIRPLAPVYTKSRGKELHVGHTFRFIPHAFTLCQLFSRAFRDREGLTMEKVINLVKRMRDSMAAVHAGKALVVDANEMNFLVRQDFGAVYFIDVDSYRTPHFPATAIMTSVRDPQVQDNRFTELSDWFAFAVVTFQLFTGIHPFKGKHPTIRGLEERMEKGISVFHPEVGLPKACYPTSVIPPAYLAWYQRLFVHGERLPAPVELQGAIAVATPARAVGVTDRLEILEIGVFAGAIRSVCGDMVHAGEAIYYKGKKVWEHPEPRSGMSPVAFGHNVAAWLEAGKIRIVAGFDDCGHSREVEVDVKASEVRAYNGAIYAHARDRIFRIAVIHFADRMIRSLSVAARVLEHASRLFDGCFIQNILGEPYVGFLPWAGACHQTALPELRGYRVTAAKFDAGVLMVMGTKDGRQDRFVYRFAPDFALMDVRRIEDATSPNFVVLDTGICVALTEDENLEIFAATSTSPRREIKDSMIGGDMQLAKHGSKLRFFRGEKLYSMGMRA